jgi:alkylhydroperoxidase family enzyme
MMGKPDFWDRIVQLLVVLAGVIALANGLFMLWDPFGWYQALETVKFTGPPNQHFIRDIGLAYVASAAMLLFGAVRPSMRWLAIAAGGMWLAFHGGLHIWEVLTGGCTTEVFLKDVPGVLGPPLLVWIALGILFARQRVSPAGVPNAIYMRVVEQTAHGESAYIHEIAAAPGGALEKFKHFQSATFHRYEAPADMFHMARLGATLVEDCGPCAITCAEMALRDGVDRDLINAALAANPPAGELQTAFVFGAAIAKQSADALALGDAIEASHGRVVRLELAMTAATVRAYPAMKRGLGLTTACSLTRLEV